MNIPIYRAKKMDGDEWVEFESKFTYKNITYAALRWTYGKVSGYVNEVLFPITHQIDPNTLAIHFPSWIDKNKNKVFVSINILGGSEVKLWNGNKSFLSMKNGFPSVGKHQRMVNNFDQFEVIGIHKG